VLVPVLAVFARTLRQGVTFDEYVATWAPARWPAYLGELEVGADSIDERRVITIVRFRGSMEDFRAKLPEMVRSDAIPQLESVIETTELNAVYETRVVDFPR
jgi:hypothetical protein